jgi:hypothetical protein
MDKRPSRLPARVCDPLFRLLLVTLLLIGGMNVAMAAISLPAGSGLKLGGGQLLLGETSLTVTGTLDLAGGQLTGVSNLSTLAGGLLTAGSGLIELSGDWLVQGTFQPGNGTVRVIDSVAGVSHLRGSNAFSALSLTSTLGKHIVLEPGSVQTISQLLTISGTAAHPIQIERSPTGPAAEVNLLPGGAQSIIHVGVSNVHATGQPLAPLQSNEGGSGNAFGWFGQMFPSTLSVPAGSPFSLMTLLILVLLTARMAIAGSATNKTGEV